MCITDRTTESRPNNEADPLFCPPASNLQTEKDKSKSRRKKIFGNKVDAEPPTLDSIKNKCNHYKARAEGCGRAGIVLNLNRTPKPHAEYVAMRTRCKTLICPECSKSRRAKIASHIRYFLQMFPQTHMLTLTLRANSHQTGAITKYWLQLRARLWKHGIRFKFFLVRELTKAGTEHLHILVSQRLNITLIRKIWHELTGDSFVVHIKKADEGAVQYLSKYLSKNQKHWRIIILKRMRLYSCSKGLTLGQFTRLRIGTFVALFDKFEHAVTDAEERTWESYLQWCIMTDVNPPPTLSDPPPF